MEMLALFSGDGPPVAQLEYKEAITSRVGRLALSRSGEFEAKTSNIAGLDKNTALLSSYNSTTQLDSNN